MLVSETWEPAMISVPRTTIRLPFHLNLDGRLSCPPLLKISKLHAGSSCALFKRETTEKNTCLSFWRSNDLSLKGKG